MCFVWVWFLFALYKMYYEKPDIEFYSKMGYLCGFFAVNLFVQMWINFNLLTQHCNTSNSGQLLGGAFVITLLPWLFIFGAFIIILNVIEVNMSEGLKQAFSNTIGYWIVAGSANKCLLEILQTPEAAKMAQNTNDTELLSTYETIEKLYTDKSILVCQMFPSNFERYWQTLVPLMKENYKPANKTLHEAMKDELRAVVYTRDAVGELFWYLYSGMVVIFMTQLQIVSFECTPTVQDMANDAEDTKAKQKSDAEKTAKNVDYSTEPV